MRSKYLIFAIACLLVATIPAASKMFDLKNYTIDTGTYSPPLDAEVSGPDTLEWSWNEGESTYIILRRATHTPKQPEDLNISIEDFMNANAMNLLMKFYSGFENINLTYTNAEEFLNNFQSLNPSFVSKPYSGYIVISDRYPPAKIYVGAIDLYNYIIICSTESDEMMALIMRELKVYAREESKAARLQAIQNIL